MRKTTKDLRPSRFSPPSNVDEVYVLWSSSLCSFLRFFVTSSPLFSIILISILFINTLNLYFIHSQFRYRFYINNTGCNRIRYSFREFNSALMSSRISFRFIIIVEILYEIYFLLVFYDSALMITLYGSESVSTTQKPLILSINSPPFIKP
jgi:hypothetical protein